MEQADKIIELSKNMDQTFNNKYSIEHHKLALCAGLLDMYNKGYDDGYMSRPA